MTSAFFPNGAGRNFSGAQLLQIAMPMGGIGAGCVCLNGHGGVQDFSIRNVPATSAMPDGHGFTDAAFALLHVKGATPITKLIEGSLPPEKIYDQGLQAQGFRHGGFEGLPRFERCEFEAAYPFGKVRLQDAAVPLHVEIEGWSPFIPLDDVNSGLPCAILEYTFENTSRGVVEFDFSYHLSHLAEGAAGWKGTRNELIEDAGIFFSNDDEPHSERFASAALLSLGGAPQINPQIKAMWFRGGWFDAISVLWREVASGAFRANSGTENRTGVPGWDGRNGGSICQSGILEPSEKAAFPIVIAWHFPNVNQTHGAPLSDKPTVCGEECDCLPKATAWRPFYAGQWPDARAVALHVRDNFEPLRARTLAFRDALFASTLPPEVVDAVACNLAILKSPTVLRQENGNLWAWEGCFPGSGCCPGSCTHVWNYAQALPHLFPALERTLREQEWNFSMDERGHVNFRAALPDGSARHDYQAAADGQLGGILKLFRDWQISGDRAWLQKLYPLAKRSLDFCIALWDPERRGVLFEPHHNTYDIEFWGADGMCSGVYIAALAAMAAIAEELGEHDAADAYAVLSRRGAKWMDQALFNGEYYEQKVQWEGLRDTSFADQISGSGDGNNEMLKLLRAEGPKYQYGTGCLSDGVIGAWMARIYGVEISLNPQNVRTSLAAIYRHNFKPDLSEHASTQRPGYALGHEAALLVCTWPRGGKPALPFPYSDEAWTGIEYQVASHLIEEGLIEEGLTIVRAVRNRYEGHTRNPFNEYECGSYYARAMASYALLGALSGFRYSAASQTLWFGPKISGEKFQTFFSTASGFGIISLEDSEVFIEMIEGELNVQTLRLSLGDAEHDIPWLIYVQAGQKAIVQTKVPAS
jgi:uncharacterized protein (DUF608 family)